MPVVKTSAPTDYTGRYRHGVDGSRRVMVPARWRPRNPRVVFTLLPWPLDMPDRVVVLPPERWRELLARVGTGSLANPRVAAAQRAIAGNAQQQSLDAVGRLCLPEGLCRATGLGKEVEMVGRLDAFEIWEPQRFEAVSAEDTRLAMEALKEMNL